MREKIERIEKHIEETDDSIKHYIDAVVQYQKNHHICLTEYNEAFSSFNSKVVTYDEFRSRAESHLVNLRNAGKIESYVPFPDDKIIRIIGGGENV